MAEFDRFLELESHELTHTMAVQLRGGMVGDYCAVEP